MREFLHDFLLDESAQDLIEYTLLLAFVAMASAGLFINSGQSVQGIWNQANSQLHSANEKVQPRH